MFIHYVDPDVSAIVLSNNESQSDYIADALARIVMDKDIATPSAHKEVSMPASVIDRYTGHYLMTKLKQYYMIRDETDRQIEFEVDKNGNLVKVWQITWGIKREVSKIK